MEEHELLRGRVPADPFGDGSGFSLPVGDGTGALSETRVYPALDFGDIADDATDIVDKSKNGLRTNEPEELEAETQSSGGRPMARERNHFSEGTSRERGSALVPSLIVVSALATLGLAMLTTGLDGARNVNFESDDYRLTSAVESVASMAAEDLWSGYLVSQGGAAGTIASFRKHLDGLGLADQCNGQPCPAAAPGATDGVDWSPNLNLGTGASGKFEYHDVNVDAMNIVRRDDGDATQLWFTVSASTQRGEGIAHPTLDRAIQVVYTVEPQDFDGFDFGILANNVNCVFCHTKIDSVERYFNSDSSLHGSFDRVKVGALETLMVRTDQDGKTGVLNDFDADSRLAGTLYVRGTATDHVGTPIPDWSKTTLGSFAFDAAGKLVQDAFGDMTPTAMSPGSQPFQPLENLYLDYPDVYTQMVDGSLPSSFPPPIPDDGGSAGIGANNKAVDPSEFASLLTSSTGDVTARTVFQYTGDPIDTPVEYNAAFFAKTSTSIVGGTPYHTVLIGSKSRPIRINGQVAIDGDVILAGYVVGEGSIIASGNVYIPGDLQYRDGTDVNGDRTFGVGIDGTKNALALAAGGNVLIGDWLRPSGLREDFTFNDPAKYEIIDGSAAGKWSFALAEMSIFNRGEWAKTQPVLPGVGEDPNDPTTWTVTNPDYDKYNPAGGPAYMPRYYHYGPGDEIPIFNKGIYYDPGPRRRGSVRRRSR